MNRLLAANPLLLGIAVAIGLVFLGGRALLGRHEGLIPEGIVAGDAGIVRSAVDGAQPSSPQEDGGLPREIHRQESASLETSVWVHGRVASESEGYAGSLAFRAVGDQETRVTKAQFDGLFELLLPHAGPYAITFEPSDRSGTPTAVALSVTIPATDEHALDLDLPDGTIEGRVRTLADEPVANARVSLFYGLESSADAPEEAPLAITKTDEQGRFRFRLLEEGSYHALARSESGSRFARQSVELGEELSLRLELRWPE